MGSRGQCKSQDALRRAQPLIPPKRGCAADNAVVGSTVYVSFSHCKYVANYVTAQSLDVRQRADSFHHELTELSSTASSCCTQPGNIMHSGQASALMRRDAIT